MLSSKLRENRATDKIHFSLRTRSNAVERDCPQSSYPVNREADRRGWYLNYVHNFTSHYNRWLSFTKMIINQKVIMLGGKLHGLS